MWTVIDNKLYRKYEFADFSAALSFMVQVGIVCEKMDHHPEWKNVYNRVEVWLCTHDAGNIITEKDEYLASKMDEIYSRY